jgi:PPOX class probable F420-dependent enzyme
MLTWTEVAGSLAPWRNYWICTVGADGPHAAPVWGVVVDGALYFFTEDGTVKARNLTRDPRVLVHLESGDDVVIVRGTVELVGRPGECPDVVAAFAAKYADPDDLQYLPAATDVLNVVYRLRPASAMVWLLDAYDGSQRRWAADPPTVSDASS